MSFNGYVQIPPDGAGKKISHVVLVELNYNTGTSDFSVGQVVTGETSLATGTVVRVEGTTVTGNVYLSLEYSSAIAFIVNENLQVNSVTYAKAGSVGVTLYTPGISIVDRENVFNGTNVTERGELVITPAEGNFAFDAFGGLSVSQETYLGLYRYEYYIPTGVVATGSIGGGTVITSSTYSGVVLTNPAPSGSSTMIQSHLYHPYNAGTSLKWIGSFACGDTGTAGVVRRWGYFDDNDGLYFELSGSEMNVCIKNTSATSIGNPVITKIPQSQWNADKADGAGGITNISGADLDPSKGFVYFIDFQWLGVGRVRFGIVWGGKRVVVHEETHSGTLDYPYMRRGGLPARVEQINYATAAGPVILKHFQMAVLAGAQHDPISEFNAGQLADFTTTINWTGSYRPILSVRQKQSVLGKDNRSIAIPTSMQIYSENAPLSIQVVQWPTLTGDTWTVPTNPYLSMEGDYTATTSSGGFPKLTEVIAAGTVHYHDFPQDWENGLKVFRKADITDGNCAWTLVAKLLNNNMASSSVVSVALNWKEIF